jgi:hypothetical protein
MKLRDLSATFGLTDPDSVRNLIRRAPLAPAEMPPPLTRLLKARDIAQRAAEEI